MKAENNIENAKLKSGDKEMIKKLESDFEKQTEVVVEKKQVVEERLKFYADSKYHVDPNKGLVLVDYDLIKKQRGLVFTLLKQIGSRIFSGKSVMDISLPVYIFEPHSLLERSALDYGYAPDILGTATQMRDPVERLKTVMTWAVASLHLAISQRKPFNPLLGETLQASLGNLEVFCEQTSHHPPVAQVLIQGPDLYIRCSSVLEAHNYPNSIKIYTKGSNFIHIGGVDQTEYEVTHPDMVIKGTMVGKRVLRYVRSFTVTDQTNKMFGQIRINPYKKGFFAGLFSKQKYRDDHFVGFITKNEALLKSSGSKVFKHKDVLALCEGNWIESLRFGDKTYWEMGKIAPCPLLKAAKLLPSDSSIRADVRALGAGDEKEAQRLKELLEEVQRRDVKLRNAKRKH